MPPPPPTMGNPGSITQTKCWILQIKCHSSIQQIFSSASKCLSSLSFQDLSAEKHLKLR